MKKLATAEMMRELDRIAIREMGIPGVVLMENAGAGCARLILEHYPEALEEGVCVVCGAGNNGGDGLVIARHLWNHGLDVVIALLVPADHLKGDAGINCAIAKKMGIPISEYISDEDVEELAFDLSSCGLVVDAVFGTGLSREVEGRFAAVIDAINEVDCPVFSVDIPSGLHSDTGRPMGVAVMADRTAAFGLAKIGQHLAPGYEYCGVLHVVDISIPQETIENAKIPCMLSEPELFLPFFLPRSQEAHKGDFGHALILGGSAGLTGAVVLASEAALKMGAGLVTAGVPNGLGAIFEAKLTEVMTAPLGAEKDDHLTEQAAEALLRAAGGKSVVAVGPGMGKDESTRALLHRVLPELDCPVVIDADGLNLIASDLTLLSRLKSFAILTPHPGEMARLSGLSTREVQEDRIGIARRFAMENKVFLVLKGDRTLIAEPGGDVYVNPTGNPGMATGGAGDVLTGMIAGMISQGSPPVEAMVGAVFLHGLAGDIAADARGQRALCAGDLVGALPGILKAFEQVFLPDSDDDPDMG